MLRTLTIRGRLAVWVLLVFAMATSLTVLDTVIWWRDGPRYTHRMWYEDRMDRIRGDDELRARIEAEARQRQADMNAVRDILLRRDNPIWPAP